MKEEEEEYMFQLYMLKVRGIEKKMKEDEVTLLRRQVEEERKGREEEKNRADQEKRKREEAERGRTEEIRKKKEEDEQWIKNGGTGIALVKSLNGIGVAFGDASKMRKENNSIIQNNEKTWVSGFIGGKLDNSVHRMFE